MLNNQATRIAYLILGCTFFAIGIVGVLLPVLPTTPFMILALWCFSKSSPRFHHWLYHHKLLGPPLQQWAQYRVIPLPAKCFSLFFMTASLIYMFGFLQIAFWMKLTFTLIIVYGAWFILTKSSKQPK